jgi:hypothetical protein
MIKPISDNPRYLRPVVSFPASGFRTNALIADNWYGDDRDRTGDPLLAKQVLSQLSYAP